MFVKEGTKCREPEQTRAQVGPQVGPGPTLSSHTSRTSQGFEPPLLFLLINQVRTGKDVCSGPGTGSGSGWGAALRQHPPASGPE